MTTGDFWRNGAYYAGVAAIIAAVTHICVILAIPSYAARDAFARLAPLGELQATVALPAAGPNQRLLPFADPAFATAFCRYDLSRGPLRVRAPSGRAGFVSLSFHTKRGNVFYALTDRAAIRGALDALIVMPEQARRLAAGDSEEDPNHELRVVASVPEGFVLIRAFSELPSLYDAALAQAKEMSCQIEATP